ncbi:hypothetical protein DSO90_18540 [Salmonella enterica]|nr:hypothetical protein [Salmonella enterica]EBN4519603.1 hypothetical protein [Salmonella enterica]
MRSGCVQQNATVRVFKKGRFFKGREAVISPPLATFPRSSVDEIADQFQNSNQRVSKRRDCSQNDD